MKRLIQYFSLVITASLLINCASRSKVIAPSSFEVDPVPQETFKIPDWHLNDSFRDEIYVYATASGESTAPKVAHENATQAGQTILVDRSSGIITKILQQWTNEAGLPQDQIIDNTRTMTLSILNERLLSQKSQLKEYSFQNPDGTWLFYLQLGVRINTIEAQMIKVISANPDLYAGFSKSPSFRKLKEEIDNPQ